MHGVSFQMKRAHLVTTAYAQKAVEQIHGMTPARYDLLALLREDSIRGGSPQTNNQNFMYQRTITERLGLHHSTVSKMLKRLEEMGWISRRRDVWGDGRSNLVSLTELGFRRVGKAMQLVYRTRALLTPFEKIARQLRPTQHVTEALTGIWDTIDGIARYFSDKSSFTYTHGLTPKKHYELPDEEKTPSAWDILRDLKKRGPRTSHARYVKKIEWRHGPTCSAENARRTQGGTALERHGDVCGANLGVAKTTRGGAIALRLQGCLPAVGDALFRAVPASCRRRFTRRASEEALAMRTLRMQRGGKDIWNTEVFDDANESQEAWRQRERARPDRA